MPDSTTITATVDQDLAGTGNELVIVDDETGSWLQACITGTTCSGTLSTSWSDETNPRTVQVHAELRQGSQVGSQSDPIGITIAPYSFAISLHASPAAITVPNSSQVTATLNRDIASTGLELQIVDDDQGSRVLTACISGTSCTATFTSNWSNEAIPPTDRLHARLIDGQQNVLSSSAEVPVAVRRFVFPVSLAFAYDYTDSNGVAYYDATATTTQDLDWTGLVLNVKTTSGLIKSGCIWGATCTAVVPAGSSYVAEVDGQGGPYGMSATWTLDGSGAHDQTQDGLSAVAVAGLFAGPSDACNALLQFPGTHVQGSSLTDQQLACETAAQSGATTMDAIKAAAAAGGAASVYWWLAHQGTVAAPSFNPAPGTGTQDPAAPSASLPTFWPVFAVAAALADRDDTLSQADADTIAKECLWDEALAARNGAEECAHLPQLVTGDDAREAADHDLDAIASHPSWIELNYRPAADNPTTNRRWYNNYSPCDEAGPDGDSCDEYPFYATQQGGDNEDPALRPSLRYINLDQNVWQGSVFGNGLVQGCRLVSGDAFLAIPMPSGEQTTTRAIC